MEDSEIQTRHVIPKEDDEEDFYKLSLGLGGDSGHPISVEKYTYDLALQEALFASITRKRKRKDPRGRSDAEEEPGQQNNAILVDEESLTSFQNTPFTETGQCSNSKPQHSISETGRSSNSQQMIFCQICMEHKDPEETFKIKRCSHVFCSDCIRGHVGAKIQENQTTVRCPDLNCDRVLDPESCIPILLPDVFERWGTLLCESSILGSMKNIYCPYKDCSALLVDERRESDCTVIRESECPHCRRLFCAECKVPWHSRLSCEEFQKLNEDERDTEDIMLMNLAEDKKWKRFPKCRFYVEKVVGCDNIKCRCGRSFNYN